MRGQHDSIYTITVNCARTAIIVGNASPDILTWGQRSPACP
ncbi:MAG: hypothetical protein ACHREM_24905 [Polyangiales bacterium]